MSITRIGPAVRGWPTSGAALDGDDLYVTSRNLGPPRLATIDARTLSLAGERTLPVGDGAWGLHVAADGLYLGMFGARGQGNVLRLAGGSLQARAQIDTSYIFDLTTGPDGRIVGVCREPALVFAYDPVAHRAQDIGVALGIDRPRTCCTAPAQPAAPARLIVGGSRSGRAFLRSVTSSGGDQRDVLPSALAQDVTVYCSAGLPDGRVAIGTGGQALSRPAIAVIDLAEPSGLQMVRLPREALIDNVLAVGGSIYATARPSGALYRLDLADGSLHRVSVPVPLTEHRGLFAHDGRIVGVAAGGDVWAHDPSTGTDMVRTVGDLGLARRPQRAQSLLATTANVDVGGTFSVTRHDRGSGTTTTRAVPGEPKAMVAVGRDTYMAMYPIAEIWCWPFQADEPERLTQLPSDQLRPISLAHSTQLDALVVTTTDDVAVSGLHVVDPITGRVDTTDDPLGVGQVAAGLLVEGTRAFVGGSGSAPAVGEFDLLSGQMVWRIDDAIPGGGFVLSFERSGNTLTVSTSQGWLASIDIPSRRVLRRSRPVTSAGRMMRAGSGLFLVTADDLLQVDPSNLSTTVVESGLAPEIWGWPALSVDPAERIWLIAGRDLARRL